MTVRFKCQTEYQRSYRSRSVSPPRFTPFAGLHSVHMGVSREPCLQRRKKFIVARPCDPPLETCSEPVFETIFAKTQSVLPLAEPETGPRHSPPPSEKAMKIQTNENHAPSDQFVMKSQKPNPGTDRNSPALRNQQPSPNNNHLLHRKAGQRRSLHKTEYNRQFHQKKATAPSPILTAQQFLHSSHSTVPPFKRNPVAMDTEYQRNFQGLVPPTSLYHRKNLDHEQTPLFYTSGKRKIKNLLKNNSEPDLEKDENNRSQPSSKQEPHALAPSNLRRNRILTEYESRFCIPLCKIPEANTLTSHTPQIKELRERALSFRRRAWGTNFSRDHLSQLLSEHTALWEPTETTDSTSDCPQSTCLDLCQVSSARPDSGRTSFVEALDLASNSSRSSKHSSKAEAKDEERSQTHKVTKSSQSPPHYLPFEEHDKLDGDEDGRLPTPKLKMLPVQRTHLDLTTPATGGAILVGQMKGEEPSVIPRPETADSVLANADTSGHIVVKPREAWSPNSAQNKPAASPDSKPAPSRSSLVASAVPNAAPLHCLQGTLRHAAFQHNGELGLRFKEQKCTRGCCGPDEEDRLSVMSWRSAASCSRAAAVLERAQKRREKFWGKR